MTDPRWFSSLRLWLFMVLAGLMGGLTACTAQSDTADGDRTDPYVQFTQVVTAVEPLVSPELDALARSQREVFGQSSISQNRVSLPNVVPLEVEGNLAIATSPELLPLNEQMYERFIQGGYQGIMDINAVSSSKAIRQFCQQNASGILTINRPMTPEEMASCQAQNRSPVGLPFGKDALVLVVNSQNEFLSGVTLGTLRAILTQNTWSSLKVGWPQRPIVRHLIGPDSDTVNVLATTLFEGTNAIAPTDNTKYFDYAEPMIQSLSTTSDGVGILSYSTFRRSSSVFKSIPINGITASRDTIAQGTYPLQQTLYLYVDQKQVQENSPVTDWVNFYLGHIGDVMPEVALLPFSGDPLKTSVSQWSALTQN